MPEEQLPEEEPLEDEPPVPIDIREAQKEIRTKKTKAIAHFAYWIAIGDKEIRKEMGLPDNESDFADQHGISRRQLQRIKKLRSFQLSVDQVQRKLWAVDAQEYDLKIRRAFLNELVRKPNASMIEKYWQIRGWANTDGQPDPVKSAEERDMTRDELLDEVSELIASDPMIAIEGEEDAIEEADDRSK